jgi:hypothetical protein
LVAEDFSKHLSRIGQAGYERRRGLTRRIILIASLAFPPSVWAPGIHLKLSAVLAHHHARAAKLNV